MKVKRQRRPKHHDRRAGADVQGILRDFVRGDGGRRTPLGSRLIARFVGPGPEELCLTMELEPGDWQLLNNHVIYHGRTHYEDTDGADRDRLLLRLWLAPPNSRALPPSYLPIWGTTAPGVPRGGIAQPAASA